MIDIQTIKSWFQRGMKPTAAQFAAVFDSYRHKSELLQTGDVNHLDEALAEKTTVEDVEAIIREKAGTVRYLGVRSPYDMPLLDISEGDTYRMSGAGTIGTLNVMENDVVTYKNDAWVILAKGNDVAFTEVPADAVFSYFEGLMSSHSINYIRTSYSNDKQYHLLTEVQNSLLSEPLQYGYYTMDIAGKKVQYVKHYISQQSHTFQTSVVSSIDIPGVIDNTASDSTDDALSANMGKSLQEQINSLAASLDGNSGAVKYLGVKDASQVPLLGVSEGDTYRIGHNGGTVGSLNVELDDIITYRNGQWVMFADHKDIYYQPYNSPDYASLMAEHRKGHKLIITKRWDDTSAILYGSMPWHADLYAREGVSFFGFICVEPMTDGNGIRICEYELREGDDAWTLSAHYDYPIPRESDLVWERGTGANSAKLKGGNNHIGGNFAVAEGYGNIADGSNSHVGGVGNHSTHANTFIHGEGLEDLKDNGAYFGKYNKNYASWGDKPFFEVAYGWEDNRQTMFMVQENSGNVFGKGSYNVMSGDYAEMFEWLDGNQKSQDRVGLFVALRGNKIVIAKTGDEVIGVVSASPAIVGDSGAMDWRNKYMTDEWGRILYDTDDDGVKKPRLNPDYKPDEDYIPRMYRKEWSPIGLLGKLKVRQDGTLTVGGHCKCNDEGMATVSDTGYIVMEVNSNGIATILVR